MLPCKSQSLFKLKYTAKRIVQKIICNLLLLQNPVQQMLHVATKVWCSVTLTFTGVLLKYSKLTATFEYLDLHTSESQHYSAPTWLTDRHQMFLRRHLTQAV